MQSNGRGSTVSPRFEAGKVVAYDWYVIGRRGFVSWEIAGSADTREEAHRQARDAMRRMGT